ncbi:MAG: hypothetical protein JSW61_11165 [Candidatus Thorarchaeota archaeon]|nr:MAG: hypothetical protein JSW61_11165 [Candidatus Thorarchaeota archaeon]
MTKGRDMKSVGGLLEKISERNRPFLNRCSETKYLAVSDPARATDEYRDLVRQFLSSKSVEQVKDGSCREEYAEVLSALEAGQLDSHFLASLSSLRGVFLDSVLRPAVREYLEGSSRSTSKVEELYDSAVKISGLIETMKFIRRVRPA